MSPIFRKSLFGLVAVGLVSAGFVGCGGTTGDATSGVDVKGRIVKSKKPVPGRLTVKLYAMDTQSGGAAMGGDSDMDGNVTIRGKVKPGQYKLSVYAPDPRAMGPGKSKGDPSEKAEAAKGLETQSSDPMEMQLLMNDTLKGAFSRQKTPITVTIGNTDPYEFAEIDLDDPSTHKR